MVCVLLFMMLRARQAILSSVLGGFLLLPSATVFKPAGLPDFDKSAIIALGTGLGCLLFAPGRNQGRNASLLFWLLAVAFVLSPFATAYTNDLPIVRAKFFFPGMTMYDGLSQAWKNMLSLVLFFIARRHFRDENGHRELLRYLVGAMLLYCLPILLEIRLSPQLHEWLYGFFPHSFAQQIRDGGFRAVVFLEHGLVVALFLGLATVACIALSRRRERIFGLNSGLIALGFGVVILLQKSLGSALLAVALGLCALLLSARRQVAVAAILSLMVMTYPVIRGSHVIDFDGLRETVSQFSADRAGSLETRLVNEERLLGKAQERPYFGWGSWGRNRVIDVESGRDITITDGMWIIVLGMFGWVGYFSLFGLLCLPICRIYLQKRLHRRVPWSVAGTALVLAFNLIDLVPNASLNPFTWILAGSLSGFVVLGARKAEDGSVQESSAHESPGAEVRTMPGTTVS